MKKLSSLLFLALALAACGPKDVEVGPYTVSVIEKNVYHVQDYNRANPAGEAFDADGQLTHFNNCSDIYLIVGEKEALVIDLSNPIDWADNAAESLRTLISERVGEKPVTVAFTHSHGDHTGMLPAMVEMPGVRFALPEADFTRLADRFPADRFEFFREGKTFELGGLTVETIAVPGHTPGSTAYFVKGHNLLFTGDAVGSGHGVWIFNTEGFDQYVKAVPHLIAWLKNPENGVDLDALKVFGGHYWQKDWLNLPKGRDLGMEYLDDMKALLDEMEAGTAATEPSNLGRPNLDTYFRHGEAIVTWNAAQAEAYRNQYSETFVCRDEDVVFSPTGTATTWAAPSVSRRSRSIRPTRPFSVPGGADMPGRSSISPTDKRSTWAAVRSTCCSPRAIPSAPSPSSTRRTSTGSAATPSARPTCFSSPAPSASSSKPSTVPSPTCRPTASRSSIRAIITATTRRPSSASWTRRRCRRTPSPASGGAFPTARATASTATSTTMASTSATTILMLSNSL